MPDYNEFQLKQLAQEVQEILSGALRYDIATGLSEVQKALARANIGAAASGEKLMIETHFDTLTELQAAVPNPKPGDAYSVGVELPYFLYIYDGLYSEWRNYGPIRAADIEARIAQNVLIDVEQWEFDDTVSVDYTYKAKALLGEVTGNDFPILAFDPSDAVGGNFSPVCWTFDGYVEIWARTIPEAQIILPAITFIVQDTDVVETGNSTKGITNAGGGIATGGVNTDMLADGSVTKSKINLNARTQYFDVAVGADWIGAADPFSQTIAVEGLTSDLDVTTALSSDATGDDVIAAYNALEHTVTDGMISFKTNIEIEIDIPITITFTAADATEATTVSAVIKASDWLGSAPPYSQTIAVEGLLESDRAKVRFSVPASFAELEAQQEAFGLLYDAESADGAITLYAKDLPGTAFSVVLEVARI